MGAETAAGFDQYLRGQLKRGSHGYLIWTVCRAVVKARQRKPAPAPDIAELARKIEGSPSLVRNRLSDIMAFYQEYLAVLHLRSAPRVRGLLALERAIEDNQDTYVGWVRNKVDRLVTEDKSYSTYAYYDFLRFNRFVLDYEAEKFNVIDEERIALLYNEFEELILVEKCKLYLDAISPANKPGPFHEKLDREIAALRAARERSATGKELSYSENIYYHLYLIVREDSEASYRFVMERIEEVFSRLAGRDARFVFSVLTNRISRRVMEQGERIESDYFRLINLVIDYPRIKVSEWMLKNFVTVFCRMEKTESAERVLHVYLPRLPADRQELVLVYNTALIRMTEGKMDAATDLLRRVTLSDAAYYVGARVIIFRAMYASADFQGLLSLTKSFRSFLKTYRKDDAAFQTSGVNYLKRLDELTRLRLEEPFVPAATFRKRMLRLREKVGETKLMFSKDWLMEEIETRLE